ncbi:MAG: polyprenol monophosphomannose synthase [Anaerolineales bacterium]
MRLVVVIPTYNEADNLGRLVTALFALPLDLRLLVVDDNSPDGTGRVADELAAKYPGRIQVLHRAGKLGFSTAYLQGFQAALLGGAEAVVQIDADLSHDPSVLPAMVDRLQNCDVVLGSRYVPGGSVDERWSFWRKGLSTWANFYARTILGIPARDVTGGYRLWRREALERMPLDRIQANGYVFQVEMLYLAYCMGCRFGEVPIYFADRRWGKSKMSFKIQIEAAFRVWQVLWSYRDLHRTRDTARSA